MTQPSKSYSPTGWPGRAAWPNQASRLRCLFAARSLSLFYPCHSCHPWLRISCGSSCALGVLYRKENVFAPFALFCGKSTAVTNQKNALRSLAGRLLYLTRWLNQKFMKLPSAGVSLRRFAAAALCGCVGPWPLPCPLPLMTASRLAAGVV